MIPAQSIPRSSPQIGERQGDIGWVTVSCAATDVDDNKTSVGTNELVETVPAEVGEDAASDAPSTSPNVTESG